MPDSGNTFLRVLQGMPAALKRDVKHPRACQQHLYERASPHAKPGFGRNAKITISQCKIAVFRLPGRNKGPHLGLENESILDVKSGTIFGGVKKDTFLSRKGVERELFLKVIY